MKLVRIVCSVCICCGSLHTQRCAAIIERYAFENVLNPKYYALYDQNLSTATPTVSFYLDTTAEECQDCLTLQMWDVIIEKIQMVVKKLTIVITPALLNS